MIYFVVVLYNKKILESVTIKNILESTLKNSLIIIDNSSDEKIIKKNKGVVKDQYTYISNNGDNLGLSKSYNKALDYIFRHLDFKNHYVCWLDDDTKLEKNFFLELLSEIDKANYDVLVPIIKGQNNIIYSPNESGLIKNHLLESKEICQRRFKRFNAINSCLTVKLDYYSNYRYDERLFLDQIDQLFFDFLRTQAFKYKVIDVVVDQNFSQRELNLDESYLQRFRIRTQDILTYGHVSSANSLGLSYLKNILLGIQFSMKTKNIHFSVIGLKSIFIFFRRKKSR
ncbi:glycosyltransferase family 2 protein [Enterococcus avium]|uniref:glycosyltransferase family 2 protein n=1 Tax=Enterococcus avium TaxID=33945 RepID=UPI001C104A23|nr:glycosyltransferase [Enterococcus avium]MBU5370986.1 glycosyltransferase [Enterococcus avium]MDO7799610.1 glycosyltransferase [Enterococcus avium]